jgi:hypothetical protein
MAKLRDAQIDFQIDIGQHGDGYRAYAESPMGEGSTEFQFPLSPEDLDNFQNKRRLYRLRTRGGVQSSAGILLAPSNAEAVIRASKAEPGLFDTTSEPQQMAEQLGRRLFDTIFVDEIYGLFHLCWHRAREKHTKLVTKIVIRDDPKLEALPWEFLFATNSRLFLATSYHSPIVRYMSLSQPPQPLRTSYPLHVLVVLAVDSESNLPEAQREWYDIKRLLEHLGRMRRFNLQRLNNPTRQELDNWLSGNPCHILHFIGHGEVDSESGKSFLLMRDESRKTDRISGKELGTLLANYQDLRVVMLNTCLGAAISSPGRYQSLSQSIASANIPAVLGMNDEITDSAARRFSNAFYDAIAKRMPIDVAASKARMAIYNHDADGLEWGTPVLYLRSPDGHLFDMKRKISKWQWVIFAVIVVFAGLAIMTELPNTIWRWLSPNVPSPPTDIQITEVNETSFTCQWVDPGSPTDSFVVELLDGSETLQSFSLPTGITQYTIDDLEPHHCYILRIQSVVDQIVSVPVVKSDVCTKKLPTPTIMSSRRRGDQIIFRIEYLPTQIDTIILQIFDRKAEEWIELIPDFISSTRDSIRISHLAGGEIETYRLKVLGSFGSLFSNSIEVPADEPPIELHALAIDVVPIANSRLLINDKEVQIGKELKLASGRYEVEIIHPQYPIFQETINLNTDLSRTFALVTSGPEINLIIGLDPKYEGFTPRAFLNGREHQIQLTPDNMPFIKIFPGLWNIEFMVMDSNGQKISTDSIITFPYSSDGPRDSIPVFGARVDFGDPKWRNLANIRLTIF